ncbi:GntR family transcriptional regulator [Pseudonocardia sp. H11422]|uniref:GntR family transcriptional regulator n=1 Tax=Pseudonocardia sp. H11422 TaxID=2835866 RepID=UPI00211147FF|nr:GntR family transcriptional regulator [Pseudonocardia sp. H11422]
MRQNTSNGSESTSKKTFIRDQLRDDIVKGRYAPGEPISERAVAEGHAVSRIPVREALIELERDGLVSILPRRGAQVRSFSAENMRSLYQAREALEGMAARLSAQRMRRDSLMSLRERIRDQIASDDDDMSALSALGGEFHDTVIQGSRNSVIIEMSAGIADRVTICKRLAYGGAPHDQAVLAGREHLAIAEAIDAGDADLAERRMRQHIATWSDFLYVNMSGDH